VQSGAIPLVCALSALAFVLVGRDAIGLLIYVQSRQLLTSAAVPKNTPDLGRSLTARQRVSAASSGLKQGNNCAGSILLSGERPWSWSTGATTDVDPAVTDVRGQR
jgi:hypothetical protein